MRTNREESGAPSSGETSPECCMCGDYGLSHELFKCKGCKFRSQHRYCSIQYPKARSYEICNFCLSITTDREQNNSGSSSPSCRNSNTSDDNNDHPAKTKRRIGGNSNDRRSASPKEKKGPTFLKLKVMNHNNPIKKQRSSPPPASAARNRVSMAGVGIDERLRRTKSEETLQRSGSAKKHVFRNKVRRYKLLEEVSC